MKKFGKKAADSDAGSAAKKMATTGWEKTARKAAGMKHDTDGNYKGGWEAAARAGKNIVKKAKDTDGNYRGGWEAAARAGKNIVKKAKDTAEDIPRLGGR